jgi:hypothetical protein
MALRSPARQVVSQPALEEASRAYLKSPEGQDTMERAAAEYVKTGLPADDLPDWKVLFENALI